MRLLKKLYPFFCLFVCLSLFVSFFFSPPFWKKKNNNSS